MRSLFRRALGQILVDGKFLSKRTLDRALEQQKQTHDLLGAVLVRMGVLCPSDVNVPLMIQGHLTSMEDAVKLAAGQRQLLGTLLVLSGKITAAQLDHAIAEHQRTGERLGEVFIRLGMLTKMQLKGLLDLQHNQESPASNPLRLGELLVTSGCITRDQLNLALAKQSQTGQKLGEVIVSEGFARRSQINHVVRLQKMCVNAVLAAILSMGVTAAASASSVSLQWNPATDGSVAGYRVHYQADSEIQPFQGPAPMDVQSATTATIGNLDPSHAYSFAVTAYDASGAESIYSNVITVPEAVPPTTALTAPAATTTLSGVVTVAASATDNVGVTKVEFYVNGVLQGTSLAAPFTYAWDTTALAAGSYTLMTKAYDAAGNVGQSATVTVKVFNDLTAPTASLTSPGNNMTVGGIVNVSASASDNVAVSRVEFYLNNSLLSATNVPPYAYNWDSKLAANGIYTLSAIAYDAAGNAGQSQIVTVNVFNDLLAPTVAVTAPGSGSTVSGTVTVTASASDNVGVSKVEFYRDGAVVAISSGAPYSYSWDTTSVANGSYTLTAKAYDSAGNAGVSQTSTVTVSNVIPDTIAPAVSIAYPTSNSKVSGTVALSVNASDNVGVARVEYYLSGNLVGSSSASPFGYSWDSRTVGDGNYVLTAKAYDAAGNSATSSGSVVTVSNARTTGRKR